MRYRRPLRASLRSWTRRPSVPVLLVAVTVALASAPGDAQQLSLGDALDRADRYAFANRATRAIAEAQQGQVIGAWRGVLPSLRFDAGFVRTTDPVGAFGTTLRQRAITAQDFDPSRLNFPAAAPNYTGAVVLEQPIVNASAWAGRRAATRLAQAAQAEAAWARDGTRLDVVRAYFGAILAREKVATLTVAHRAAREHVRQAELMVANGLVTPSDALLASVKAGDAEVHLLEASGDALIAIQTLATALGTPNDTLFTLPIGLPVLDAARLAAHEALEARAQTDRSDIRAAELSRQAANADVSRARAMFVPRVNGFARYDWNSALRPYQGESNWTVGLMASWSVFSGASEIADVRATNARRAAADAATDGSAANATLDDARATMALRTALARADIASRNALQSSDAHRIVSRRYSGGLASVVELLDAAAVETQAQLAVAAARYELIVSASTRRRALGLDPGAVRVLDQAPVSAIAPHPEP